MATLKGWEVDGDTRIRDSWSEGLCHTGPVLVEQIWK